MNKNKEEESIMVLRIKAEVNPKNKLESREEVVKKGFKQSNLAQFSILKEENNRQKSMNSMEQSLWEPSALRILQQEVR